jgi:glutathione S-transferase
LAEKTGGFLPKAGAERYDALQWLFWQMGGLGPMAGQNNHFRNYAVEKIPYAIDRYVKETNRLYGVLNKRLADREFIAGDYSIADMASYPWIVPYERQGRISSAGLRASRHVQRHSAPMSLPKKSIQIRQGSGQKKSGKSCLDKRPSRWQRLHRARESFRRLILPPPHGLTQRDGVGPI